MMTAKTKRIGLILILSLIAVIAVLLMIEPNPFRDFHPHIRKQPQKIVISDVASIYPFDAIFWESRRESRRTLITIKSELPEMQKRVGEWQVPFCRTFYSGGQIESLFLRNGYILAQLIMREDYLYLMTFGGGYIKFYNVYFAE